MDELSSIPQDLYEHRAGGLAKNGFNDLGLNGAKRGLVEYGATTDDQQTVAPFGEGGCSYLENFDDWRHAAM